MINFSDPLAGQELIRLSFGLSAIHSRSTLLILSFLLVSLKPHHQLPTYSWYGHAGSSYALVMLAALFALDLTSARDLLGLAVERGEECKELLFGSLAHAPLTDTGPDAANTCL